MLFSVLARSCRATSSEMVGRHPLSRVRAALTVVAANGRVTTSGAARAGSRAALHCAKSAAASVLRPFCEIGA